MSIVSLVSDIAGGDVSYDIRCQFIVDVNNTIYSDCK